MDGHLPNWNILVSREKKSTEIPKVVTSEIGTAQTYRVPRMNPLLYRGYTTYYRKIQITTLYKEYRKMIWKGQPKRVIAPYLKYLFAKVQYARK